MIEKKPPLKIVIIGHIDHGKSTFIGRLLNDTKSLPENKIEQIKIACKKRRVPFEWSFILDSLKNERDQGITIEVAKIFFKTQKRDYLILDAPGHKEFLKNMITGASNADVAILIIDAKKGVEEQTRRHTYLAKLLGIKQILVLVNKMDKVNYNENIYKDVCLDIKNYLNSINLTTKNIQFIPISARDGVNIINSSKLLPWYNSDNVIEAIDNFSYPLVATEKPLYFPVQDIYKFNDKRIIVGKITSGKIKVGDEIIFSPSDKITKVKSIENWNTKTEPKIGVAGQSIGITLDEES
jgi:bifunctional enzyme CysN/CysC